MLQYFFMLFLSKLRYNLFGLWAYVLIWYLSCSNMTLEEKSEMGPDPTRACFWPAVNKRPGTFWHDPTRFFLARKAKNWKIWDFKGKFYNAKPKPKMADPTRVKNFWSRPIPRKSVQLKTNQCQIGQKKIKVNK